MRGSIPGLMCCTVGVSALLCAQQRCTLATAEPPVPSAEAAAEQADVSLRLPAWRLAPGQMGDLYGAMAGQDYSGLIGALYQRRPFPRRRQDFAQKPQGTLGRPEVVRLLDQFIRNEREK